MKTIAICALALMATSSLAFGGMGIEVRGLAAIPMGDFGDYAGTGFGGGVGFMYGFAPNYGVSVGADYVMFGETEFVVLDDTTTYSSSMIPIKLAFWYAFPMEGEFGFYVDAFAGYYMITAEMNGESGDTEGKFGFGGGVGFMYMFSPTMALDVFGNFNHVMTSDDEVEGSVDSQYIDAGIGLMFFLGGEENDY
jgi:hypothetical protein